VAIFSVFFFLTLFAFFFSLSSSSDIVRLSYSVSGVWLGFGFYVGFVLALIRLALLFFPVAPRFYLSLGLFGIAIAMIVTTYGVWNAQNPQLVHVPVQLSSVPEQWKGKKLVQISDVHL